MQDPQRPYHGNRNGVIGPNAAIYQRNPNRCEQRWKIGRSRCRGKRHLDRTVFVIAF